MKIKKVLIKQFLGGVAIALTLSSCNPQSHENPLTIEQVMEKRDGKKVYIAGEIIRTVPLVKNGAYQVKDQTDQLWILTTQKLPKKGSKVSVLGKVVYQELSFSENQLYIQEIEVKPYNPETPE